MKILTKSESMKQITKISAILITISALFATCNKEENEKLSISNVVAENHNGGEQVSRGGTIAVEFSALAGYAARLDFYHIEIHDHPATGLVADEYKIIDDDFKDKSIFKGLRNADVHEHIYVPDTANIGSYHVVITVIDEDGNSVNTEDLETHITVVE